MKVELQTKVFLYVIDKHYRSNYYKLKDAHLIKRTNELVETFDSTSQAVEYLKKNGSEKEQYAIITGELCTITQD